MGWWTINVVAKMFGTNIGSILGVRIRSSFALFPCLELEEIIPPPPVPLIHCRFEYTIYVTLQAAPHFEALQQMQQELASIHKAKAKKK